MTRTHLTAVADLEFQLAPQPWTAAMLADELIAGAHARVLLAADGVVTGHVVTRALLDEWHLMILGVARGHQRRGWGRRLLADALQTARNRDGTRMLLEVRVTNQPAIALYRKQGFLELHRRRNYYTCPRPEDALVMALELASDAGHHSR
ncbi:MAG: ribosomal protein S18-alanine N-acetyltransferase [Magnetococcales bacterium]|nr:ribosomal protein S18-alanine N-acetyltransferase [Magnetococcales bacterium]